MQGVNDDDYAIPIHLSKDTGLPPKTNQPRVEALCFLCVEITPQIFQFNGACPH